MDPFPPLGSAGGAVILHSCFQSSIGTTLIRQGTKIDNLVQVAHNNRIGKHVILAGQVGLSGSVTVGDYAVLGGRVGTIDHVSIGEQAQVGACALITKSIPARQIAWGMPARPLAAVKRQMAALAKLPALWKRLVEQAAQHRRLEERLEQVERKLQQITDRADSP